jgi:APA family basic amino acid/polyamine antiporter
MGEDYEFLKWFSKRSKKEIPVRAIIIQAVLSIGYILTSTFEQVITLIGFTLNLFTLLAVIGMMLNRRKQSDSEFIYRVKLYPVIPIIFILINAWIIIYGLIYRPMESFAGIGISLAGLIFYFIDRSYQRRKKTNV